MTNQATERTVTVGDIVLHVSERGADADPPLLMVHGLNTQLHTWDPVADVLASDHHVVSVDLRGHGDSSWTQSGYWLADFVGDLAGLVGALGMGPVGYIGHSFGGRIGVAFAGRHPQLVDRLVISDSGPEMATGAARDVQARQAPASDGRPLSFRNLDEVRAHYRAQNPDWDEDTIELYAQHQVRANWAGKLVLKADPELYWLMGSAGRKEIGDLWDDAARIQCPSLLLWATRGVLDAPIVERMQKAIPQLEVERFDCGHGIPRERTAAFLESVQRFLAVEAVAAGGGPTT